MINPVIGADCTIYKDKSTGKYYLVATGDNGHEHFYIYESNDKLNWKFVSFAYDDRQENNWGRDWFWAPEIYFNENNGYYYLFYSAKVLTKLTEHYFGNENYEECCKIGVAVSRSPIGPFINLSNRPIDYYPYNKNYLNIEKYTDKIFELKTKDVPVDKGEYVSMIDANLFVDEDKRTYLYYSLCCYHNAVFDEKLGKFIEESYVSVVELENDFWFNEEPCAPRVKPEFINKEGGIRKDPLIPLINYHNEPQDWENSHVSDYENKTGCLRNRRWSEGSTTFFKYFGDKKVYFITYSCNLYTNPFYGVGIASSEKPLNGFKKYCKNPIISSKNNPDFCSLGHGSILQEDGRIYYFHHGRNTPKDERSLFVSEIEINGRDDIVVHKAIQLNLIK